MKAFNWIATLADLGGRTRLVHFMSSLWRDRESSYALSTRDVSVKETVHFVRSSRGCPLTNRCSGSYCYRFNI